MITQTDKGSTKFEDNIGQYLRMNQTIFLADDNFRSRLRGIKPCVQRFVTFCNNCYNSEFGLLNGLTVRQRLRNSKHALDPFRKMADNLYKREPRNHAFYPDNVSVCFVFSIAVHFVVVSYVVAPRKQTGI